MSAGEVVKLITMALDVAALLSRGEHEKAERKARLLAETFAIKRATRAAAKKVRT